MTKDKNPEDWKREDDERLLSLVRSGATRPEIASNLGIGAKSVPNAVRAAEGRQWARNQLPIVQKTKKLPERLKDWPLVCFQSGTRIFRVLSEAGIHTKAELLRRTWDQLLRTKDFGAGCRLDLRRLLSLAGLSLPMDRCSSCGDELPDVEDGTRVGVRGHVLQSGDKSRGLPRWYGTCPKCFQTVGVLAHYERSNAEMKQLKARENRRRQFQVLDGGKLH